MSVRAPRRSNADGLSENMLKAILDRTAAETTLTPEEEKHAEKNTNSDKENVTASTSSASQTLPTSTTTTATTTLAIQKGASFLDSTTLSTCSKRSLHSSRQTLSDPKEFYKTTGCRWIRAVRLGDATTVKKMLEDKPELVNYAPNYGPFALHIATVRSDRSIIKLLLMKGADVDARDATGCTSLHLAIRLGKQSLAHFLISHGANMELSDSDGRHITDYDEWSDEDQLAAEKSVYGKPQLRAKAHSFIASSSPSSASVRSCGSLRPPRPSSTPNNSSENEKPELRRDKKRSSWKTFFDPLAKKFGSKS